jgi:chemotaxis protein methyltransferase CheR
VILMLERFPELAHWDVKIVATDISRDILQRAKGGRYSQLEVNRGLPAPLLVKYFDRCGMEWSIKESVRKLVQFDELNLIRPWKGLPACDLVFMRNVLIYFDVPTKKDILAKIRQVMRPDGYLFLGSAETTMNIDSNFTRVQLDKSSCYRIGGA